MCAVDMQYMSTVKVIITRFVMAILRERRLRLWKVWLRFTDILTSSLLAYRRRYSAPPVRMVYIPVIVSNQYLY